MKRYFVFNGDADGICAAHQFYLNNRTNITAITGVKRDISLLKKLDSLYDTELSVFDIAIEKNLPELIELLKNNCKILWFDHHVSEEIPQHQNFQSHINTSPLVNTSYLVSKYLESPSLWAIVGLCGDNVFQTAESLAKEYQLSMNDFSLIKEMGELLNYNGYGGTTEDLHIHPADILASMKPFENPLDFAHDSKIIPQLREGMRQDLAKAYQVKEISRGVYQFPNEKWARRAIGVFANRTIVENPDDACAVLVEKDDSFVVSVRSALNSNKSAAEFCKKFPSGGGRIKAAGINCLQYDNLTTFIEQFHDFYSIY